MKHGISLASLTQWRRRLRTEKGLTKPRGAGFVSVGPFAVQTNPGMSVAALILRFPGGVELALDRMPDAEWLRRVLRT
jgi:hypothetical protein